MTYYQDKNSRLSHFCLNSFKLSGLDRLDAGYRLIRYSGLLEKDRDYEKKVRLLAMILGGRLELPTEPIRWGGERLLAVIGECRELASLSVRKHESLNPESVSLDLDAEIHPLRFGGMNTLEFKLAKRALSWAIQGAADKSSLWWVYGNRY